jgi:6-methylsalicylate decarboxylase
MRIDVHQHLWTEPLMEALERRSRLPFVRRDDRLCTIHLAGETPSAIDLESEAPALRAALLEHDRIDRALIALSSPLGIEALPRADAHKLIDAHLDGVGALGEPFAAWGPLALDGLCADDVDALLERDCVGASLPAGAFGPPPAMSLLRPALARLEELEAPLFIHPGPGLACSTADSSVSDPLWWPAMTRYVAQMQAAWLAFCTLARRAHPDLRVIFAMLAGGAPLLSERLEARGGPTLNLGDPHTYYETSSFGPVAIDAMARRVGAEQLLYGSDRPVVDPTPSGRDELLWDNAEWLAARAGALR